MPKKIKILIIILSCFIVLGIAGGVYTFVAFMNTANADQYIIGNEPISSIKSVVGKRPVSSVSVHTDFTGTTKTYGYKSNGTVREDLSAYVNHLTVEDGFRLTSTMNLEQPSSTIKLEKESQDYGKMIIIQIDYDDIGYTITIQKVRNPNNV